MNVYFRPHARRASSSAAFVKNHKPPAFTHTHQRWSEPISAAPADLMLELPVGSMWRIVEEMLQEQGAEGYRVGFDAARALAEIGRQWLV